MNINAGDLRGRATDLRHIAAKYYTRQTRHISEDEYMTLNTAANELDLLAGPMELGETVKKERAEA